MATDGSDRKATLTGVAISLGGNIVISLALNLQKLAHSRLAVSASTSAADSPARSPDLKAPFPQPQTGSSAESDAAGPPLALPPPSSSELAETTPLLHASEPDSNPWASQPSLGSRKPRRSSSSASAGTTSPGQSGQSFLRSPLWWLGLLLLSLGELGNFVSYGFAPASVVAPLGTAALVANWVFAPLILNERFRSQDSLGALLAILGAFTIVVSAKSAQPVLDPDGLVKQVGQVGFAVYSGVVATLIAFLAYLSERPPSNRPPSLLIDVALCALLGSYTVLSTKALSGLVNLLGWGVVRQPVGWVAGGVLVVTALGQLRYLNKALQRHPSKHVVPLQFASFTLAVLVGSAVLYRDFDEVSPRQFVVFLAGLGVLLGGVGLLTAGGEKEDEAETEVEEADGRQDESRPIDLSASPPSSPRARPSPPRPSMPAPPPTRPHVILPRPSTPPPTSLPIARSPSTGVGAGRPRLRRLSTASVRGLSAGGLLLSSSLGRGLSSGLQGSGGAGAGGGLLPGPHGLAGVGQGEAETRAVVVREVVDEEGP